MAAACHTMTLGTFRVEDDRFCENEKVHCMTSESERFIVLTGGPGSGKSTLIDHLQGMGYGRSQEAERGIIQDQVGIGGRAVPWADPALFAELN